jgi:hypothetical protein
VRKKLISKSSILYENRGPVALCVNGAVVVTIDDIIPLPEIEVVETIVFWTGEGGLGGEIPPMVATVEGV